MPRCEAVTISWIRMMKATLDTPVPKPITSDPVAAATGELPGVSMKNTTAPTGMKALPPISMGLRPMRLV